MYRKLASVISCLLLCIVLVGCSGSASNSTAYPSASREAFMSSCIASAESSGAELGKAKNGCECVFDILQREYSFEEFRDAEEALVRGEASGLDLEEMASRCF